MKLSNIKRLLKEDFPKDQQDLIDKLAYVLNPFLDQVSAAFNKQISIENMTREIITITVSNATGGAIQLGTQFKSSFTKVSGINVIKSQNITNTIAYPTSAVGLSWSFDSGVVTINKVTGIQDNNKYTLTLEVIN